MNIVYSSTGRSAPRPLHKALQRGFITGRYGLDAAVVAVSYPPRKPKATRFVA